MRKGILGLTSTLLFSLIAVTSTSAVEFGQDATGDPNAVKVGGASGFLYSDRIVFTAAHVIESTGGLEYWEREGVIYTPGIVRIEGQKRYKVKKVLIAPTYRPRVGNDQTRVDDFAIIILQEGIPMKNEVLIANGDDISSFINKRVPVSMIGYGLQSPSQRTNSDWRTRTPMKMTSYIVSNEELRNYYRVNANMIGANQTILDYGIPNSQEFGSVCDGDSGSGFFVERGNIRYYLGLVGGFQAGIPNCRSDGSQSFGVGGGMSGITATYKFLPLIKEAESIVSDDKQKEFIKAEEIRIAAESKAKQEAEAKAKAEEEAKAKAEAEAKAKAEEEAKAKLEAESRAKAEAEAKAKLEASKKRSTITCVKGKLTKKVSAVNPKCPKGYKKK